MAQQQLVLVDTTQIQPYVFGSNRLRENVGASYLVAQVTGRWALEAMRTIDRTIESLYSGGGNFAAVMSQNRADDFTRSLSRKVMEEAPGLQIVIARKNFDNISQSLATTLEAAFQEMQVNKLRRVPSAPLLGVSVTRACASTGFPAVDMAQIPGEGGHIVEEYAASTDILAKLDAANDADFRLSTIAPPPSGYRYPRDFENLGATFGDQSYIAVVHIDGDGIGQRLQNMSRCEECTMQDAQGSYEAANIAFRHLIRAFSTAIDESGRAALRTMIASLNITHDINAEPQIAHPGRPDMAVSLRLCRSVSSPAEYFLPVRPIVFGGDDVAFVCDGRLGLALAIAYMRAFEAETGKREAGLGQPATACAGIAIVKSHYPFARAYAMAEELCKSAKRYKKLHDFQGSCLDWHFALSGLFGSVDDIRWREYRARIVRPGKPAAEVGHLELRPVTLGINPRVSARAWPNVKSKVKVLQTGTWAGKRNKVKELRDVLRDGPDAVERFALKYGASDLTLGIGKGTENGWPGGEEYCSLFDAVELADFYIPLQANSSEADS